MKREKKPKQQSAPPAESCYYQVDFVAGDPNEVFGENENDFYGRQNRLIQYLHANNSEVIERDTWINSLSGDIRKCITADPITIGDQVASVEFEVTDGCELTLSLVVYTLPGGEFSFGSAAEQELTDAETATVGPGTHSLEVALPCDGDTPPESPVDAPPLDETVPTSLDDQSRFLYEGEDAPQTGVDPEVIDSDRVAVLRGQVLSREGNNLKGVTISILDHPEFGQTTSRADGTFDMAVNGGGQLTVTYEYDGYLDAQRSVDVPWQEYTWLPDVALVPAGETTAVDLSADEPQIAQGGQNEDEAGSRQPTLLFPQSADTSTGSSLEVTITEFTVGEDGSQSMPDELPPSSAYTYAVDFTATDASGLSDTSGGGSDVRPFIGPDDVSGIQFESPVYHYVENFLEFPVGGAVPTGYYEYDDAAWVPSPDGRILEVLGERNGLATLDVDGSGQPATTEALADLDIDDAERRRIADLYDPGESFWRTPIPHFSPWDHNWPFGPPDDAEPPNQPPPQPEDKEDEPCPAE